MSSNLRLKLMGAIIPTILLFLFVRKLYLEEKYNLDPWLGGGMGMFASIDGTHTRVAGFMASTGDSTFFVNFKDSKKLFHLSEPARMMPSQPRLKSLLAKLKKEKWCTDCSRGIIPCSESKVTNAEAKNVIIEKLTVYRLMLNGTDKTLKLKPLETLIP